MKKSIVATLVCVAILLIGGNFAFASSESEPFKLITAPEVKDLLEEGKVVVSSCAKRNRIRYSAYPGIH